MSEVLPTVAKPGHAEPDPNFENRVRYYARDTGPSRWLLHAGEPRIGEGEETPEGHVIRYAPGTSRIVGLTMMGPRHILERDGHLTVTIPEAVETTAQELAPALAAV